MSDKNLAIPEQSNSAADDFMVAAAAQAVSNELKNFLLLQI